MTGNLFYTVKKLSRKQNLAIAYWFYKLSEGIDDFRNKEEFQALYNALVQALGLQKHSQKITRACIELAKKAKALTPVKKENVSIHPFFYSGDLPENFKEDSDIYDICGMWDSSSVDNINLIRAVFSGDQKNFSLLIAHTFFSKPDKSNPNFSFPPGPIEIPNEIIEAARSWKAVQIFVDSFKLTEDEAAVLNVAYMSHTVKELYEVFNELGNEENETRYSMYGKCTGLSEKNVKSVFRLDSKLISYGIMHKDGDIDEDAIDCVFADDLNVFFADVLKEDSKKEIYDLNSFSVKEDETELALRLLKNPASTNLLLFGAVGAGKTEYARSLAQKAGFKPYIFKNNIEVDEYDNSGNKALSRLNCLLSLKKKDAVIIVDEAESILDTARGDLFSILLGDGVNSKKKGTVNAMLENSENKVIWILNYTDSLDESTRRRFTYSIRFSEMTNTMLKNIAGTKLNKIEMSSGLRNQLVELCGKYHVTGASVDNMVKTIQGIDLADTTEEIVLGDVNKVLEANSALIYGKSKMREKVKSSYDLSVLNTSIQPEKIVSMIENAQKFAEKHGTDDAGIRMLFYGASGTGKTELARYIAQKLNKKIVLKRASDIFNKYVGESEKNVQMAFEEAEASGDILLFDEADSFFADRNDAEQNWERTMVNEFLTQMEEFKGILICTTNLRKIMDSAMQRRFHIMCEFKPLKSEGVEKLLSKFFDGWKFNESQINRLAKCDTVTPGDFGSLAGRIRFMDEDEITSDFIVDEICNAQNEKEFGRSHIGFCR